MGNHEDSVTALAARLLDRAHLLGLRVAVAESLTGGALADALVSVPGASRVFSGAVVAYDVGVKQRLLGVEATLLAERGAVDESVVMQMARGVREACALPGPSGELVPADVGIATTGVAGPAADPHSGLPAGTVWLGLSLGEREAAVQLRLSGDRAAVRAATVREALVWVLAEISVAPDLLDSPDSQGIPET